MDGWREGGMDGGMDRGMDGGMDGWLAGWMDGWMDGWMGRLVFSLWFKTTSVSNSYWVLHALGLAITTVAEREN